MWNDFKAFAFKGNMLDLAIGVIIGAAFGKIVSSIVNDLITPLFGILFGGIDFPQLVIKVGDSSIKYGNFIQTVIDFLLVAFSIFLFIRLLSKMKRKAVEQPKEPPAEQPKEPPAPSKEELLLTEIRDLLKQRQ